MVAVTDDDERFQLAANAEPGATEMRSGYRVMFAAVVRERDGFAVELHADDEVDPLAEVFRDDDANGELSASFFSSDPIPFDVLLSFIESARKEFAR